MSSSVLLRKDEVVDAHCIGAIALETAEEDEQQGETRQALLPVDDEALRLLLTDDDRTQEVVGEVRDPLPIDPAVHIL